MNDGEKVVRLLAECGKIMAKGEFSAYDLKFIKQTLEKILNATDKTIMKNNISIKNHSTNIDVDGYNVRNTTNPPTMTSEELLNIYLDVLY